ncbi:MAG: peptidyl-prolyl cis-trans isomerase [Myxococcales bacterium]|nr:peptidyl-prolyl cis-trans isomerase [Myxococcales bacterium]
MVTTLGTMTLDLNRSDAPITAANFLDYVDEGFFDGDDGLGATMFHRVISGFMIQGGGYTSTATLKDTHAAIVLEADNGLSNLRGTIAMARTNQADSATTQFFINHVDNTFLDYANAAEPGYAVFGEVTGGLEVLDALASVETAGPDQPVALIEITDCERQ